MKLYGKDNALARLRSFADSGRFPHALLFIGEEGIGKKTLADYAAMMYVCENKGSAQVTSSPCMNCSACRRVAQKIHPDVVNPMPQVNNPPKDKSGVQMLKDFLTKCYRKPTDAEVRVIIIDELDSMREDKQNTLLKEIEEPVPHNRFIFTAAKTSGVLATVLSRVVPVELAPAGEGEFLSAMRDNDIDGDQAARFYSMFGGNIGKALSFSGDEKQAAQFTRAAAVCDALCDSREFDCYMELSAMGKRDDIFSVLGLLTDIFAAAAAKSAGVPQRGKRAFAAQKERVAEVFGIKTINRLYREACRLFSYSTANPNAALFAAECCAVLFSAAYDRDHN